MAMTTASEVALSGQLLLIDRNGEGARQTGAALSEALLAAPRIVVVETGRAAADTLRQSRFDIVIADLSSLDDLASSVADAVARLVKLADGALVLAMAEGGSVSAALGAMQAGAHDYVAKPIGGTALAGRIGELAQRH